MIQNNDEEFDPLTPEEIAEREREAELARRIRRELRRVNSGEADDDIREDEEREAQEREQAQREEERRLKRKNSLIMMLISGDVLEREWLHKYYQYPLSIAVMFFVNIVVIFTMLGCEKKYARVESEVQLLRERSVRLQELRYRKTTHTAISDMVEERGLGLIDPKSSGVVIEN